MPITRKELRRFKKADLLKLCLDNSIDCSRKSSKNELVDKIFKNKELKGTLIAPPARQISEKQRANLKSFRFKTTSELSTDVSANILQAKPVAALEAVAPKSKKDVEPTASNQAEVVAILEQNDKQELKQEKEIAVSTPLEPQSRNKEAKILNTIKDKVDVVAFDHLDDKKRGQVEALEPQSDKKFRDKASEVATRLKAPLGGSVFDANRQRSLDSHTSRLLRRINTNKKKRHVSGRELLVSIIKTTDAFDRKLFSRHADKNRGRLQGARVKALGLDKDKFDGDLEALGRDVGEELSEIKKGDNLSLILELVKIEDLFNLGKITLEQRERLINELRAKQNGVPAQPQPSQPVQPSESSDSVITEREDDNDEKASEETPTQGEPLRLEVFNQIPQQQRERVRAALQIAFRNIQELPPARRRDVIENAIKGFRLSPEIERHLIDATLFAASQPSPSSQPAIEPPSQPSEPTVEEPSDGKAPLPIEEPPSERIKELELVEVKPEDVKKPTSRETENTISRINKERKTQINQERLIKIGESLGIDVSKLENSRQMMRALEQRQPGILENLLTMTDAEIQQLIKSGRSEGGVVEEPEEEKKKSKSQAEQQLREGTT